MGDNFFDAKLADLDYRAWGLGAHTLGGGEKISLSVLGWTQKNKTLKRRKKQTCGVEQSGQTPPEDKARRHSSSKIYSHYGPDTVQQRILRVIGIESTRFKLYTRKFGLRRSAAINLLKTTKNPASKKNQEPTPNYPVSEG